jgi:hypothetical protein
MNYHIIDFVKKYFKSDKGNLLYDSFVRYFKMPTYIYRIGRANCSLMNLIDSVIVDDILGIILSKTIPDQPHEIKCYCGEMMYVKCKTACYLSISIVCKRWNKVTLQFLVKNVKWYCHLITSSCLKSHHRSAYPLNKINNYQ